MRRIPVRQGHSSGQVRRFGAEVRSRELHFQGAPACAARLSAAAPSSPGWEHATRALSRSATEPRSLRSRAPSCGEAPRLAGPPAALLRVRRRVYALVRRTMRSLHDRRLRLAGLRRRPSGSAPRLRSRAPHDALASRPAPPARRSPRRRPSGSAPHLRSRAPHDALASRPAPPACRSPAAPLRVSAASTLSCTARCARFTTGASGSPVPPAAPLRVSAASTLSCTARCARFTTGASGSPVPPAAPLRVSAASTLSCAARCARFTTGASGSPVPRRRPSGSAPRLRSRAPHDALALRSFGRSPKYITASFPRRNSRPGRGGESRWPAPESRTRGLVIAAFARLSEEGSGNPKRVPAGGGVAAQPATMAPVRPLACPGAIPPRHSSRRPQEAGKPTRSRPRPCHHPRWLAGSALRAWGRALRGEPCTRLPKKPAALYGQVLPSVAPAARPGLACSPRGRRRTAAVDRSSWVRHNAACAATQAPRRPRPACRCRDAAVARAWSAPA